MTEIIRLDAAEMPGLSQIGRKALELIRMSNVSLPVPPGFVLTTAFFSPWINKLRVSPEWKALLTADATNLTERTAALKSVCRGLTLGDAQRSALERAVETLKIKHPGRLFAVRSSSPEEDGVEASFAGSYATVLGVTEDKLEEAILECFSSSFDERVYWYKKEHQLEFGDYGMAVIIQALIHADTAGVAFSINPLNNCYDEAVINANYGLGESVVSGRVDPDWFIVDKVNRAIMETRVGRKGCSVRPGVNGGTISQSAVEFCPACLSSCQVQAILDLLTRIESHYGDPVDIEWAFSDGQLFLLQVRPITTYYPLPPEMVTFPGERKRLYANSTLVEQGLQGPLSVLGGDFVSHILKSMSRPFGGDITGLDGTAFMAGGRYYMNLSNAIKMGGMKRAFAPGSSGDETLIAILKSIDLKQYLPDKLPKKLRTIQTTTAFRIIPLLKRVIGAYRKPEKWIAEFHNALPEHLSQFSLSQNRSGSLNDQAAYLTGLLDFFNVDYGIPMVLAAQIAQSRIRRLFKTNDVSVKDRLAHLGASLPGNKTAEMGLGMYELASSKEIRAHDRADEFLAELRTNRLSQKFIGRWKRYMDEFGARCPGEIDAATARPIENPAAFFDQLKTMGSAIAEKGGARTIFEQAREKREAAYKSLYEEAMLKGKAKAKAFNRNYRIWSMLGGYREMPKHYIIKAVALFRQAALDKGAFFVQQGRLDNPEQIFDLMMADIDAAQINPDLDLRRLRKERTAFINKARRCRLAVRIIDSRGKIFTPVPSNTGEGELSGIPISPGIVRGRVKVLRDPVEKQLLPGEILVASSTDPGWTPLFIHAGGIILEVGGALQHGAVVAREYGVPCVSGVENATGRLKDGELVEVNGSKGRVRLLT